MPQLLVNLDVDDVERAVRFYTEGLTLSVGRRFDDDFVELLGAEAPIYLLRKDAGTKPFARAEHDRHYSRHWTPVHLDFVVSDLDAALARAQAAGAVLEKAPTEHAYGRLALLADPFGHGFCLLEFKGRGYDELGGPADISSPSSQIATQPRTVSAGLALALALLGCGGARGPSNTGENAPLPALSAVAAETKTPTTDPAPGTATSDTLSIDECRSRPGEVLTDKGDGALHAHGCPDGRQELGVVRVGIENGLCCAPPAAASAPTAPVSGKRPPCTTDQACNDDESVSALWGKCTPLGVCECKPGFALNPRGRCEKPAK